MKHGPKKTTSSSSTTQTLVTRESLRLSLPRTKRLPRGQQQQHQQQAYPNDNNHDHDHNQPYSSLPLSRNDKFTRFLFGSIIPLHRQNNFRNSGSLRSFTDKSVFYSIPGLALSNVNAARTFLKLGRGDCRFRLRYGIHRMQVMDVYVGGNNNGRNGRNGRNDDGDGDGDGDDLERLDHINGLIFFVHGGAWGSGLPWMYRLIASSFLDLNMAVVVVGYRTYPDGDVVDQVDDLEQAAMMLVRRYPHLNNNTTKKKKEKDWLGCFLMGHSSGAHIAFLLIIRQIRRELELIARRRSSRGNVPSSSTQPSSSLDTILSKTILQFNNFVGLSGVYDINHHFDFEAGRGVEEISPMKPACGYTRESFQKHSPTVELSRLQNYIVSSLAVTNEKERNDGNNDDNGTTANNDTTNNDGVRMSSFPRFLLIHGMHDSTVPFTSTANVAHAIRACGVSKAQCQEVYLPGLEHIDVAFHLMLGGLTRDLVREWIVGDGGGDEGSSSGDEIDDDDGFKKGPTSFRHPIASASISKL